MGRARRAVTGVLGLIGLVALTACVPGGTPPPTPDYAALGDSFSAGVGAGRYDPGSGDCTRSPGAWPRLIDPTVDLRACAGARTQGLLAQLPSGSVPAVELVTMTIGGNDAGFGDLLEACVLDACPSPTDPAFVAKLATLTATLATTVYPAIADAYPNADLVHVGYPRLTPPPGDPNLGCVWLSPADQAAAAALVDAINDAIEAAVAATAEAVAFVDVTDAFDDHELCTPSPWVVRVIDLVGIGHPNAAGHQALATTVAAAL